MNRLDLEDSFSPSPMRASRNGMTHPSTLFALAILALAGCRVPPEAPAEIDDLTTYLYENHDEEDPLVLAAGVDSFVTWLDENFETLDDKYSITPLSEETVDSLDDEDRTSEGLIGLAVVTTSEHSVEDAAFANTAVSIEEVYGDQYTDYTREVVGDVDCFLAAECDRLESDERYTAHFPLGLQSQSHMYNQYVWSEGEVGRAYIQRNWLVEKPTVNNDLLDVDQQMYLNVLLPRESGGHYRLQATWMIVTQSGVDPGVALNLTANSMRGSSEELETWMDENL